MSGAPPPVPRVQFPHQDALAEKWFAEAVRFLHDASILHQAKRYPASVASSQKAAELAVKAVLILDGSLGRWDRLEATHRPLEEIEKHPVLGHHRRALDQHNNQLVSDVLRLERLAPSRSEKKDLTADDQANTEYPFFFLEPDPATGDTSARLLGPKGFEGVIHQKNAVIASEEGRRAWQSRTIPYSPLPYRLHARYGEKVPYPRGLPRRCAPRNDTPFLSNHFPEPLSDYFQESESLRHYRTARSLIIAYQAIDLTVQQWGDMLPDPLGPASP